MSDSGDDMEFYAGGIDHENDEEYEIAIEALKNIASVSCKQFNERPEYWMQKVISLAHDTLKIIGEEL